MDYLFKYMLLSFSICCARTIQASRDASSENTECDIVCRQNGNRICFSNTRPYKCVCAANFVERDGMCWENPFGEERRQKSKSKDRVWEIDNELDSIREQTKNSQDTGVPQHHGHHEANLHIVNHPAGHAHPHKDKLKHLHQVASTLSPPRMREGHDPAMEAFPNERPNTEEDLEKDREVIQPPRGHSREFEVPNVPTKEYHIRPKPHHHNEHGKGHGKHEKNGAAAKTVEVASIGEEEIAGDAGVETKQQKASPKDTTATSQVDVEEKTGQGEANIHGKAEAIQQGKPDERHGKLRNMASMADVYFLAQNVPKQFHVVDSSQENLKEIRLQVKDESNEDPQSAPIKGSDQSSNSAANAGVSNIVFIAVVAGCSVAGLMGLVVAGVCWYSVYQYTIMDKLLSSIQDSFDESVKTLKEGIEEVKDKVLQKNVKAASEAEYPAYGVTGPSRDKAGSPGDRKLAQSAQMYHYQHQKQQMLAMERAQGDLGNNGSDVDSEEEEEGADYTVYECPGLAPTGEMEVKNPLFNDDTPVGSGSNHDDTKK